MGDRATDKGAASELIASDHLYIKKKKELEHIFIFYFNFFQFISVSVLCGFVDVHRRDICSMRC